MAAPPTPSPSPGPPIPTPSLTVEINTATRKQHTHLNRLIIERLPLALPPNAQTPKLYGRGLAVFARIYYAIEAAWRDLPNADGAKRNVRHDDSVLRMLFSLLPCGLSREHRLLADLRYVSAMTAVDIEATLEAEQQEMLDGIHRSIQAKPHLLVAYSWVMYMAVFSGGRWIRQQLSNAGPAFWAGGRDAVEIEKHGIRSSDMPGFSFLSFDGQQDGEDIKLIFKSRLAEVETLLTQEERQDIVQAARILFEDCSALVEMLDFAVASEEPTKSIPFALIFSVGAILLLFYAILRFG